MPESKTCSKCNVIKPATIEYFNKHKTCKNGLRSECKECEGKRSKLWYKNNKDKARENQLKNYYDITIEDYNKMFAEQEGKCKICGAHQTEFEKKLGVDHNHKTGKIRGLLCDNCNIGIGNLNHNPLILIKASKYLSKNDNI